MSPAYLGTWHRSSFPDFSERRAGIEVDALLDAIGDDVDLSIVAQSLGGRIVSRPEVHIHNGNHLMFVPLLQTPKQYVEWLDGGTRKNQIRRQSSVTNYMIGPEGERQPGSVRSIDFIRAFFERGAYDMTTTLPDLWMQKNEPSQVAHFDVVIAEREEKAGGIEFSATLENFGWSVQTVQGAHLPKGRAELDEELK